MEAPNVPATADIIDVVTTTQSINYTTDSVFYFYKDEHLTFLYVLFALIVFGNLLVIIAISLNKTRNSRMHIFILNLAIADVSVGLVNVLTDIVWKSTVDWYAGNAGCKIIRYCQGVVTYASTYALVALSLDRLNAIARPLSFSADKRRIKVLIGLAWALAFVFSTPMLAINKLMLVNDKWQCWIQFPEPWFWKLYMTSIAVVLFFFPAIIIAVCYIIIVIIIWKKTIMRGASVDHTTQYVKKGTPLCGARKAVRLRDCVSSSSGVIPRAKMKTIKMTLVIVSVFVFCWSPYFIYDLLSVYEFIPSSQDIIALSTFIQSLAPLNSVANPIIYASFNTKTCVQFL
ncbi:unnamed protein product, partial [Candidula unifasciata]